MFNKFERCHDMGGNCGYVNMPTDPSFDMNNDGMVDMKDLNMAQESVMANDCKMQPIVECGTEKCIHRNICHQVEHICPINTKIVNHHIYKHVYKPLYTCCEENEVSHINEGSCCNFR